MDSSEIISELKKRGFNKNAAVTQETLYSEINRDQLFSNTNRLNAGWGRGKVIIAKYQSSSHSESEYIREWLNLANKYQDQFLCLETAPGEWNFYDYNGKLMSYQELFPTSNSCQENITSSYRSYITAIKSKPFLLLAGILGTGKSRIVRELARACWDVNSAEYKAHKPKNFEMVQVKPNWHDSSELIGYVSRIDGVRYVVGPFLKFMVKAIQDPNTPYFLCLDEMNLAPVEQYFAEFLSVVESRKVDVKGNVVTDPLVDYSSTEEYKSLIDQLFL